MSISLIFLIFFTFCYAFYGALKRDLLRCIGIIDIALLSLGLIQGESGPFVALGTPFVTIASASGMVLIAILARQQNREMPSRPSGLFALVGIFFLWILIGGLVNIELAGQWRILSFYCVLFVLPMLLPYSYRTVPVVGLVLSSLLQLVATLATQHYILTLSGVRQLSGGVQPNILALQAVSVALAGLWLWSQNRTWSLTWLSGLAMVVLGVYGTIGTVSRSGFISLIAGSVVMLFVLFPLRWIILSVLPIVTFIMAVIGGLLHSELVSEWFTRGDSQSLSSLTGRTDIWSHAFLMVTEKPILGWGFGALYNPEFSGGSFLRAVEGTNAHNAWLQLMVEVGVIGTILMTCLFMWVCQRVWRKRYDRYRLLFLGLMAGLVFNAAVSASFATLGFGALLFTSVVAAVMWDVAPPSVVTSRVQRLRLQANTKNFTESS